MPWFTVRYSGDALYLLNSTSHSSGVMGGSPPANLQSVIARPERVRRVTPPNTTILNTHPVQPASQ
jgi:hypothetical protein